MSGKLVRDRIVEIITAQGISTVSRRLVGPELVSALRAKLDEEIAEYDAALGYEEIIDELADIVEVVYALGRVHGIASGSVDNLRRAKAAKRGAFAEGIWLES